MFDDFIIGVDSQIGSSLYKALSNLGRIVSGTSRREKNNKYHLDLSDDNFDTIKNIQAKNLYLVAAMTSFKECRENQDLAKKINLYSTIKIAKIFAQRGSKIIFLSSIASVQNFDEMSHYGALKAQAEYEISRVDANSKIIRLSKVIAPNYPLFKGWLENLSVNKSINAFGDLSFSPISLSTAVDTIVRISESSQFGNIFQLAAAGNISYYESAIYFAKKLFKNSNLVIKGSAITAGIPSTEIIKKTSFCNNSSNLLKIYIPPDPYSVLEECYLDYLYNEKN